MTPRQRIRSAFAVLMSACALGACDPLASRYTAEESAYFEQFGGALGQSCSWGTPAEPAAVFANSFAEVYVKDVWALNREFRSTLPPPGLETVQAELVAGLKAEFEGNAISSFAAMQRACAGYLQFRGIIDEREFVASTNDSYFLTFSPRVGPSITLDTRDGFSIAQSASLPIPNLGSVRLGHRESRGIHRLQILFGTKRRVFVLDRPFEFYIPAGYAITVKYDGGDDLVLIVEEAEGKSVPGT